MKTKRFLLAAGILLAMAFTLSCSDSGGKNPVNTPVVGPSGTPGESAIGNPSELPDYQVYLVENDVKTPIGDGAYNGNVSLSIDGGLASIPVGKITNGKLSFDSLPNMESSNHSSYLENFSKTGFTYPSGLKYLSAGFVVNIPGKSCYIEAFTVKSSGERTAAIDFVYFSQTGSITGSATYSEDGETRTEKYDASFLKGWNFLYEDEEGGKTTRHPEGDDEWWLECFSSGIGNPSSSSGGDVSPSSSSGGDQSMACYFESVLGTIDICIEPGSTTTNQFCDVLGASQPQLNGASGEALVSCPTGGFNCPQGGIPVYVYNQPDEFTCEDLQD